MNFLHSVEDFHRYTSQCYDKIYTISFLKKKNEITQQIFPPFVTFEQQQIQTLISYCTEGWKNACVRVWYHTYGKLIDNDLANCWCNDALSQYFNSIEGQFYI